MDKFTLGCVTTQGSPLNSEKAILSTQKALSINTSVDVASRSFPEKQD